MAFSSPVTDLAQQVHSAVQSGRQDRAETDESVPWRQPMPHGRATKPSKVSATWPEGVKISGKSASISVTGNKRTVAKSAATLAVQESRINAGGKTRLHATGAGQASNITVTGSDIQGAGGTLLAADNRILLQSATFGQNEESRHQSSGWNVGATVRYDGKPNIGITAGGQTGRGNGHGADENHRHSHIGSSMQGERTQSWGCSDGMGLVGILGTACSLRGSF